LPEGSAAADNPFAGLEDPAAFIAARRAAIAAKVDLIYEELKRNKRLPEGVSPQQGISALLMSGRERPDLIDHGTALMVFIREFNSSFQDVCIGGLIARGFRPDDLDILRALVDNPDYPNDVLRKNIETGLLDLPQPEREKAGDEAIKQYLDGWRRIAGQTLDDWAVAVLNKFPLRARRILMTYIYERMVPNCKTTQWLPLNERDIRDFRYPEGLP